MRTTRGACQAVGAPAASRLPASSAAAPQQSCLRGKQPRPSTTSTHDSVHVHAMMHGSACHRWQKTCCTDSESNSTLQSGLASLVGSSRARQSRCDAARTHDKGDKLGDVRDERGGDLVDVPHRGRLAGRQAEVDEMRQFVELQTRAGGATMLPAKPCSRQLSKAHGRPAGMW